MLFPQNSWYVFIIFPKAKQGKRKREKNKFFIKKKPWLR